MKRCIVAVVVLSLTMVAAAGSTALAQFKIEGALKGGAGFSDIGGNDAGRANMSVGLMGGFSATMKFANFFSLQPELLYARKGADQFTTTQERYVLVNADIVLDYIEVPVLVKLNFPMANNLVPGVYAGPFFAFKLRSKLNVVEARSEDGTPLGSIQPRIVNAKSTDIGLVIGTALALEGPTTKVIVDVRYSFGFNSFLKEHSFVGGTSELSLIDDNDKPLDLKNRTFAVMVGVGF